MTPLVAAAWLCAVALGSVGVEADALIAARARETRLEDGPTRSTGELEVVPRVALLRHGRLELSLSYAPRLTLPVDLSAGAPELESGAALRDSGEVLHRVDLAVDAAATRSSTLGVRAAAEYGRIDLLRADVYADDVLPDARRLAWRSLRASGSVTTAFARRTRVAGTLGAFEAGGAQAEAREIVPLQRGALLEAVLRHDVTRRDELSLRAAATYSRFTPAADVRSAAVVRVGGGWSRHLRPTLAGRAESGAAWSVSERDGLPASRDVAPFAEAWLSHTPTRPLVTTEVALRVMPYVSPLTGAIEQRLDASAATRWSVSRRATLSLRGAAAATRSDTTHGAFWTGTRRAELASLDLRASWSFARRGTVAFGPRARWQESHDASLPAFFEWGAAVELTAGTRPPE